MPRYNVKHPTTGEWRCFSSIVDAWVTDWMDKERYEAWRKMQYGRNCGLAENANMMSLEEAEEAIKLRKQFEAEEEDDEP